MEILDIQEINAVKAGSSTITVSAAGVTNSFEVNVYDAPKFTDFSKANYEVTGFNDSNNLQLKITGITPNIDDRYSFIITKDNNKPNLKLETNGALDLEANGDEYLLTNTEENYMYNRTDLKKYFEQF